MGRNRNTDTKGAAHRRLKRWLFCIAALILIPVAVVSAYVLSRDAWHMLDEEKLSYEQLSVQIFDGEDRLFSALGKGENRLLLSIEDLPARQGREELIVPVEDLDAQLLVAELLLVQHVPGVPAQHVGGHRRHGDEDRGGHTKKPPPQAAVGNWLTFCVSFPSHDGLVWDERGGRMLMEQESTDPLEI